MRKKNEQGYYLKKMKNQNYMNLQRKKKKKKSEQSKQPSEHTRANKEGIMNKTKYINQKNT